MSLSYHGVTISVTKICGFGQFLSDLLEQQKSLDTLYIKALSDYIILYRIRIWWDNHNQIKHTTY